MLDRKPYTIEHIAPLAETDSRRAKKLTIRSAHDLRRREFPAIRYVVPGYIAEGCTILAGRPKLGKSWLVLDMGLDHRYRLKLPWRDRVRAGRCALPCA
jgi:AAA domain-containing protein